MKLTTSDKVLFCLACTMVTVEFIKDTIEKPGFHKLLAGICVLAYGFSAIKIWLIKEIEA